MSTTIPKQPQQQQQNPTKPRWNYRKKWDDWDEDLDFTPSLSNSSKALPEPAPPAPEPLPRAPEPQEAQREVRASNNSGDDYNAWWAEESDFAENTKGGRVGAKFKKSRQPGNNQKQQTKDMRHNVQVVVRGTTSSDHKDQAALAQKKLQTAAKRMNKEQRHEAQHYLTDALEKEHKQQEDDKSELQQWLDPYLRMSEEALEAERQVSRLATDLRLARLHAAWLRKQEQAAWKALEEAALGVDQSAVVDDAVLDESNAL